MRRRRHCQRPPRELCALCAVRCAGGCLGQRGEGCKLIKITELTHTGHLVRRYPSYLGRDVCRDVVKAGRAGQQECHGCDVSIACVQEQPLSSHLMSHMGVCETDSITATAGVLQAICSGCDSEQAMPDGPFNRRNEPRPTRERKCWGGQEGVSLLTFGIGACALIATRSTLSLKAAPNIPSRVVRKDRVI